MEIALLSSLCALQEAIVGAAGVEMGVYPLINDFGSARFLPPPLLVLNLMPRQHFSFTAAK